MAGSIWLASSVGFKVAQIRRPKGFASKAIQARLCRLMCGRPLAFREARFKLLGYAQCFGRIPSIRWRFLTEARSASAHQAAQPRLLRLLRQIRRPKFFIGPLEWDRVSIRA